MHRTALALLAVALSLTQARATSNRTFVSALGNDANPCSVAAPCRTMQAAFNQTAPGGEIEALDPTGYGALTITHAVSIQGHGWASMNAASGQNVITIDAGASDRVTLRGLILEGFGVSADGIKFDSGASLVIEDSVVQDMTGDGLLFSPAAAASVTVSHTRFVRNTIGAGVVPGATFISLVATFEHVIFDRNLIGFESASAFGDAINIALRDCSITNNQLDGMLTGGNVMMLNSTVAGNATGIFAGTGSTVRISKTIVTGNQSAYGGGGTIASYGNNQVDANTTNSPPSSTIALH
jgi:hypothetical protein